MIKKYIRTSIFLSAINILLAMNANAQTLSEKEIKEKINKAGTVQTYYLEDSTGVYDKYVEIISLDASEKIAHSLILNEGYPVEIAPRFISFLKHTTVPSPYKEKIYDFLNMSEKVKDYEKLLWQILGVPSLSFNDRTKIENLLSNQFETIVQEKERVILPLVVYIGETIKSATGGQWDILLDQNFLCHVPVIKGKNGNVYYPYYIANKFLNGEIPELDFYIGNFGQ